MEFIDKYKYKKDNYSKKINESKYIENLNNKDKEEKNKGFDDIFEIYLLEYDINYQILDDNEKENYLIKKKIDMASNIMEFNYNRKINTNIISNGLQQKNLLSSILYFNDYFNCNLVIYNKGLNRYYKTGIRDKNLIFCNYDNKRWFQYNNNNDKIEKFHDINELNNIITFDIETNHIYKLYLKSISNYKMNDLIDICKELNIDIMKCNKKKIKRELYDEINIIKLNES